MSKNKKRNYIEQWADYLTKNKKEINRYASLSSLLWLVILGITVFVDSVFVKSFGFALFMIERVYNAGFQSSTYEQITSQPNKNYNSNNALTQLGTDPGIPAIISFLKLVIGILSFGVLVVPGIYIMTRLRFSHIAYFDNNRLSPFEAIKKSWQLSKGTTLNYLKNLFVVNLAFIIYMAIFVSLAVYVGLNLPAQTSIDFEVVKPMIKVLSWVLIFMLVLIPSLFKRNAAKMSVYKIYEFKHKKTWRV